MILQREIAGLAEQYGVAQTVVDKDWVLGHFVSAIYSDEELKAGLVFKGGTCLRKCWFPVYRFSEDLDFTALSKDFVLTEQHLTKLCNHVLEHAGILTSIFSLKPVQFQNRLAGYEAIIKYWGADHPKNDAPPSPERWQTRIKIEITLYEALIFESINRPLQHPYSDALALQEPVACYAIEEVLAEKIRALIQRSYTAPRDYYDIWYLSNHIPDLNWPKIAAGFYKKMEFKGLEFTGIDQLINPKSEKAVRLAWKNSLSYQIGSVNLPAYDEVKNSLLILFNKVFDNG